MRLRKSYCNVISLTIQIKIYQKREMLETQQSVCQAFERQTDVFIPHCLSSALFLCRATGNVFRPTKSHTADYHTAREHRQVRPTKYQVSLSVSCCLETSSCVQRAQEWKLKFVFDVFLQVNFAFPSERLGSWPWERRNCNTWR